MRKKKVKKRNKSSPNIRKILFSALGCLAVLLLLLGVSFYNYLNPVCANSISCIKDLSGIYEGDNKGTYLGKEISGPSYIASDIKEVQKVVLGESTGGNKHIYIDLSTQQLSAYEGNNMVFSFPISSGKWYPTPTGDFRIWIKLRYTRMAGGNSAIGTYYNLPNVPFTMFFYNSAVSKSRGFGLHGAYWHNNFGHPMSHGCVNISIPNAEKLYNWADPPTGGNVTYASDENQGTPVTIYGVTPNE